MKLSLILIGFILSSTLSYGQDYDCPKPLVVGDLESNNYTVIYPIGWSKRGYFAYIQQDINGLSEAEHYRYSFFILGTDSSFFTITYDWDFEYGSDSLFSLKMDSLTTGNDPWNSAVLSEIVWPDIQDRVSRDLKKFEIEQTETDFTEYESDILGEWKINEHQIFGGEADRIALNYQLKFEKKKEIIELFNVDGSVNEDGLGTDRNGNEIWYKGFRLIGAVRSQHISPAQPHLLLVLESSDGHEEPWEFLHLIPFVPSTY